MLNTADDFVGATDVATGVGRAMLPRLSPLISSV